MRLYEVQRKTATQRRVTDGEKIPVINEYRETRFYDNNIDSELPKLKYFFVCNGNFKYTTQNQNCINLL